MTSLTNNKIRKYFLHFSVSTLFTDVFKLAGASFQNFHFVFAFTAFVFKHCLNLVLWMFCGHLTIQPHCLLLQQTFEYFLFIMHYFLAHYFCDVTAEHFCHKRHIHLRQIYFAIIGFPYSHSTGHHTRYMSVSR